ncbi:MAG TPA: hypothetical protein VK590_05490 [Saprospiraceae bacterium]|nr:hypothetical protein [Saprospiraceae bacterium]
MVLRLHDLEKITKPHWGSPHQWRYKDKNIEFGLDTSHGMQWFPYCQAPIKIEELVNAYKKMLPKIELRQTEED